MRESRSAGVTQIRVSAALRPHPNWAVQQCTWSPTWPLPPELRDLVALGFAPPPVKRVGWTWGAGLCVVGVPLPLPAGSS